MGATQRFGKEALDDTLAAVDVDSGKQLLRKAGTRVVPYALSALAGRVVCRGMDELMCLDAKTGNELWRAPNIIGSTAGGGSTLVITDGVVLFHGHGQAGTPAKGKRPKGGLYLTALSLDDGTLLWQHAGGRCQAAACTQPTDLFVAQGTVWCGGSLQGRDLRTGEVANTRSIGKLISPARHYRCHRSKATERFLIWPKRGAKFVDLTGDERMRHDWL